MAIAEKQSGVLPEGVREPYDWALDQMRVAEAHAITRGSPDVVVAVIDLGYRFHPDHEGHLWVNPRPTRGDVHGWDFAEEDATLEYEGERSDSTYQRGHHAFVVGEVAVTAPKCPIMVLRVGYEPHHQKSWPRAIRYAVDHGAKVLIMPHGYITLDHTDGEPLFHKGTDFNYPYDNIGLIEAMDYAYQSGCLIFKGTADNRGRRVATVNAGLDSVFAVGSTNRHGRAANIAASADYAEAATPGGERHTDDPTDSIWGTGGDHDYIPFQGGCMASAFGGGVAALAFSQYPHLSNREIREILRNTSQGTGWDPLLGHGIFDAYRAVSLAPEELSPGLRIDREASQVRRENGRLVAEIVVENTGVYDVSRMLTVAFNGDPKTAADSGGTREEANILIRRQIGHCLAAATGLGRVHVSLELDSDAQTDEVWVQVNPLDLGMAGVYDSARIL